MSLFPFNTGIPASGDNPSVDQPGMLQNNVSTNGIIGVDHNTFNNNLGGYHTDIHMDPQGSVPPAIAGIGQLFAQIVTVASVTDTQLFFETGTGVLNQLTGSKQAFNGFAYLGNIILQWGFVNASFSGASSQNQTTSFNLTFPNNCFIVLTTPYYDPNFPSGVASVSILSNNNPEPPTNQFTWTANSNSSQYTGFYWFSVGN